MGSAKAFRDRVAAGVARRFGTAPARYRMALSGGFVIAAVGMATVVIGQAGQAEDFFSAFGSLFSAPQAVAPQVSESRRAPRRSYAGSPRHHRVAEREPTSARHRRVLVSDGVKGDAPMRLGRASMCVRLCDGFAFPVGAFHGEGDIATHEATCRSECPGAQTALYVLPNGASSIDEAIDVHSGRAYSQKAAGFHYTTYLDESCSCHPKSGNRIASLLHDFTLRRGDAVVTASGVKVFHGAAHFPYSQVDFVRLAQSRDVKKAALTTFRAIERASITSSHPVVAEAAKPVPAASLKSLDHQASLLP